MNTKYISRIAIAFFLVMIFVSCESHEQKADVSDSSVVKSILPLDTTSSAIIEVSKKTDPIIKKEALTDWDIFKIETEKKIVVNENKIKAIKSVPNENVQYFRKVANLEKDNNDLRKQLEDYRAEEKVRWEKFKSQVNQDVGDINKELGEMKTNGKVVSSGK